MSAAQGQRASRCCCSNALIVAGSSRHRGRGAMAACREGGWGAGVWRGRQKSPTPLAKLTGIGVFVLVAAGVCCCQEAVEGFHQFISYVHTEYQTPRDLQLLTDEAGSLLPPPSPPGFCFPSSDLLPERPPDPVTSSDPGHVDLSDPTTASASSPTSAVTRLQLTRGLGSSHRRRFLTHIFFFFRRNPPPTSWM